MLQRIHWTVLLVFLGIGMLSLSVVSQETKPSTVQLRVATFDVDATPPVGSAMAYQPVTNKWDLGLRARGIVLVGAGQPIYFVCRRLDWDWQRWF